LKQDRVLQVIKKRLVRKVISMIQDLTEDHEQYAKFWKIYGNPIKSGIIEDPSSKERLSKLLRFQTSQSGSNLTSLSDYIDRMKPSQEQIYYIGGVSVEELQRSPHAEKLLQYGYELVYCIDAIDEWVMNALVKYDRKYPLTNIAKEGWKLDGVDSEDSIEEEKKLIEEEYADLIKVFKDHLKNRISKVEISLNLLRSPCAISAVSYGYSANMERIFKAQALHPEDQADISMRSTKVFQINPKNPIMKELKNMLITNEKTETLPDIIELLYDTAALQSGYMLDDAPKFARRIHKLLKLGLNLDLEDALFESTESKPSQTQEEAVKDEL